MEYENGILVVTMNGRAYLTPGGGANKNESRMQAALREIKEETGVEPYFSMRLFEYRGRKRATHQNVHTVYYVKANGTPKPAEEVTKIAYYKPGSKLILSGETREIIGRFLNYKKRNRETFTLIDNL